MKKLLTIMILGICCNLSAFPDMRNFSHKNLYLETGNKSFTNKDNESFYLVKYIRSNLTFYQGYCKQTKYSIKFYGFDGYSIDNAFCEISNDNWKTFEKSIFHEIVETSQFKGVNFYFASENVNITNRLLINISGIDCLAAFQTIINND